MIYFLIPWVIMFNIRFLSSDKQLELVIVYIKSTYYSPSQAKCEKMQTDFPSKKIIAVRTCDP